ncbi:MAG: glycosyltransferase family 2 protein [Taibaiella sp.]|nr:glycosyltransferase family 2 protein [Taibaiella sp.]
MSQPLVSICIPSYNRADLIEETISSALAQSYHNVEVIVNDNCSTDDSWPLLESLAAKDVRLKIFRNDSNLGAVRNWQRVMAHATGKYALILWSDDLVKDTFVEKCVAAFEDDVAFVMCGVEEFSDQGVYYSSNFGMQGKVQKERYYDQILFKNKNGLPVSPSCALFRTEDLRGCILDVIPNADGIDFNRTGAGPDVLTFLITSAKYPYIKVLPDHLALFRSHPSSITVMENKSAGLKLHYDWAKYHFVKNYLPGYLPKLKAITWIRNYRYKGVFKNMLADMRHIRTDFLFMCSLFMK